MDELDSLKQEWAEVQDRAKKVEEWKAGCDQAAALVIDADAKLDALEAEEKIAVDELTATEQEGLTMFEEATLYAQQEIAEMEAELRELQQGGGKQ